MQGLGKRVAILVYDLFEQSEFTEPLAALRRYSVPTTVVSAHGKELHSMQHARPGDEFEADVLIENITPYEFDMLILPGGVINADKLRMSPHARRWVLEFFAANKPVAAICHAPWLLVSADLVEERVLTSYYTLQDDIRNAGGEWVDRAVVVDRNLITSRQPDDLGEFNAAILSRVRG